MEPLDARSLTDFLRHHRDHVEWLQATGEPLALTIAGRPEVVVQSVEAYLAAADRLRHVEAVAGLLRARGAATVELEAGSRVAVTEAARDDVDAIVASMRDRAGAATAAAWRSGLMRALATLPGDHPPAPESPEAGFEAREMPYRAHRAVFEVVAEGARVLRVLPGAGESLTLNLLRSAA